MNLISEAKQWMQKRSLTDVVVGFSGGVDSATTAALFAKAGLRVHLVVADSPNQKYRSPLGGIEGARKFADLFQNMSIHHLKYNFIFTNNVANEAAAPIQRVATFYGLCAQLRENGARPIVAGTINFDEGAYLGYWGKASDGAQDVYALSHLHKSEVCLLAKDLGVFKDIINAEPSGDLLFSSDTDFDMIGASYEQIESISRAAEKGLPVSELILKVHKPMTFCQQVIKNSFKYELPMNGFHFSSRIEIFRKTHYSQIFNDASIVLKELE